MKVQYLILNGKVDNNFKYSGVDYEYDDYICDDSDCGCRDGSDYCRCSHYEGLKVKNIDLISIKNYLLTISRKKKDVILTNPTLMDYCVDRLLRIYKIYESDHWDINTSHGYYGDEVDSICLDSIFEVLLNDIKELCNCTLNSRVKFILKKEYGHLLPSLNGKNYIIKQVKTSDLVLGNKEYYRKVDNSDIVFDDTLPIGIYLKENNKYKLIDGYHRYSLLTKDKKEVEIISAE